MAGGSGQPVTDVYHQGRDDLKKGAFKAAVQGFQQVLEKDPGYPGAWRDLGLAHYRLEQWREAEEAFEKGLVREPGEANLLFRLGLCQLQGGRVQDAIDTFAAAAAAGKLEAHFQLGLIFAGSARRKSEKRQRAIHHFEAIVEAVDKGEDYDGLDRVCFALGNIYTEGEETHPQAIKAFRKGLSVNPLSALGHNSLGVLLMRGSQILGALGEFKVAIQLDPTFRAPYTHLARLFFHHVKPGDLPQEYQHIAEEFGPSASQVLARLSLELVELGREQAYEGLYTKGHQLKNLLGIAGSRLRSLVRRVRGQAPWEGDLAGLAAEHEQLYEEWVRYLEAMKPERVRPGLFDPAGLVYKVVETVKSQTSGAQLRIRVQEGVPRIEADERMLREAVTNLCLNALEALAEGGGEVGVGVGYNQERAMVFIEVEDDGPGIAEEHLKHVFDPGFSTKERGNGYGLSIARRLVQAHHGELRVKSRLGHGAVFRLDIPLNYEAGSSGESLGDNYL